MIPNAGNADRVLRIVLGMALLLLAANGSVGWLGLLGGIALIASGLLGWCAFYRLLGLRTRAKDEEPS